MRNELSQRLKLSKGRVQLNHPVQYSLCTGLQKKTRDWGYLNPRRRWTIFLNSLPRHLIQSETGTVCVQSASNVSWDQIKIIIFSYFYRYGSKTEERSAVRRNTEVISVSCHNYLFLVTRAKSHLVDCIPFYSLSSQVLVWSGVVLLATNV